jgi:hypothetical protein
LNWLKYLGKCPVRFPVLVCLNQPTRTEPNRFGLGMKKKYKPSGSPPPITFPFNNPSRPFICFPFHTAAPSPPTLSIFIHTSQTQPPPSITPTPINSRSLPLTAASSSPVNELRLFSDNHSSNLERNRRACEVAKLLPLLDLLQSIASIKADYIAQVILSCNYIFN